jgi:hypothetical protein
MARELPKTDLPKKDLRPTHDEIARRAYEIFIERGRPEGQDQEHWFAAEAQLTAAIQQQAKTSAAAKAPFFSKR